MNSQYNDVIKIPGHDITPRSSGCRVVYWLAYITAVVVLVGYTTINISFLAIRRYGLPFEDLQGIKKSGYKIIISQTDYPDSLMMSK